MQCKNTSDIKVNTKNVSVSAYQHLGLDLVKSGKVSVSSRTESQTSRCQTSTSRLHPWCDL